MTTVATPDAPTKPRKAAKGRAPQYPHLAIDPPRTADNEAVAAVEAFHADGRDFDKALAKLLADRESLLTGAMELTLRDFLAQAASVGDRKQKLEQKLAALRWQRFEIMPQLEPAYRQDVADATAAHEATIEAEMKRFIDAGVDENSFPAAGVNSRAAGQQFRHRVNQELPCMSALAKLHNAQSALRSVQAQMITPPREQQCTLAWPALATDGFAVEIGRLAGIV